MEESPVVAIIITIRGKAVALTILCLVSTQMVSQLLLLLFYIFEKYKMLLWSINLT